LNRFIALITAILVSTPALAQWGSAPAKPAPAPAAAAAPAPASSSAPGPAKRSNDPDDGGFAVGVRAAWTLPFGDLNSTDTVGSQIAAQVPIWLELGWRFNKNIFAGVYGQYAFGFSNNCPIGNTCSTNGFRLGVEGIYNFAPDAGLQPWAGLGIGYEWLNTNRAGQDYGYKGWELAHLELGIDYAGSKQFSIGPFASITVLGKYTSQSSSGFSNDISASHNWLQLGLKATFKM